MKPAWSCSDVDIYVGDSREVWRDLPENCADAIVTSPPYFSLRDYGAEGQLGLEESPDEYIEALADLLTGYGARVMKPRGSLWVNLGETMASEDTPSRRFWGGWDGPAYGSAGTALAGSMDGGSSSTNLCDGCRAPAQVERHRVRSDGQRVLESAPCGDVPNLGHTETQRPSPDSSDSTPQSASERSDRATPDPRPVVALSDVQPPASQQSMTAESSPRPRGGCSHCGNCGACLSVLRSSSRDGRLCARTGLSTGDTSSPSRSSGGHNSGREPLGSAWGDSTITFRRKSVLMIPERVALALIARGWILRNKVVWAKPNGMPSSVKDRLATKWEYLFHLTREPRYWYDLDAVREAYDERANAVPKAPGAPIGIKGTAPGQAHESAREVRGRAARAQLLHPSGANPGDWWVIPTQPYPGAHYAVYPPELIRRPILATVPEQVCRKCGTGRERIVERSTTADPKVGETKQDSGSRVGPPPGASSMMSARNHHSAIERRREHVGWTDCGCGAGWQPGTVLDPFIGSGTTGQVARRFGRRAIGVDLDGGNLPLIIERLDGGQEVFDLTGGDAA